MHLSDLPHGCLILRCDQVHTIRVFDQLLLIDLGHASYFWILPFRRVLTSEKSLLFICVGLLHLLMLFLKLAKFTSKCADSLTLASVMLEEFDLRVSKMVRFFCQLVGPLREYLFRSLVKEPDLIVRLITLWSTTACLQVK